jgi:hypothetical protein
MIKRIHLILFCFLITLFSISCSQNQDTITLSKGSFEVIRVGKTDHYDKPGTSITLLQYETLKSGKSSRLLVNFKEAGDTIELYSNTTLHLPPKETPTPQIFTIPEGKVRLTFKKPKAGQKTRSIKIRTSSALIGIKGTDLIISTNEKTTNLLTLEGVVGLASLQEPVQEAIVTANQISKVDKGFLPTKPVTTTAEMIKNILAEDDTGSLNIIQYGKTIGVITRNLQIEAPKAEAKNQKNILSWSKIEGIDHYNLYWSNTPKPDIKNAQKITNLQDSYIHKNLSNKKAYYYFLTPVRKSIEGPPSPVVKLIPDLIIPTPKGFNVNVIDNDFSLVWIMEPNAILYTIYWNTKAENLKLNGKRIVTKNAYYVHKNPKPNTNYYFAVSANYEDGESLLTRIEKILQIKAPIAKAKNQKNILSWSKIEGIDHYNLYWSNTPKPNIKNAQKISNLQDSLIHKNLTNKKAYYYFLTPVSKSIEGPPSPVVKSIPDLIAPTPKGFNVNVIDNEFSLVWITEPNAISYTIYWNTKAENLKLKGKRIVTKNAYYVFENPKPNTIYYFAVLANYEDGESLLTSIEKILQIKAPIAKAKNQKNILSWSKIEGIDHYNLYWSNTPKPNIKNAQKITNLQDNFVHKNLTNKKAYYYFLTPVRKSIEGPPSPVIKSIPDLIAPTPKGFNIKVTNNEISLVWETEPNAIFYTIYWNTKAENLKLKGKRIVTKNTYYVYENPKPNTIYYFAVLANYEDGESLLTKIEKALQIEAPIAEAKNQKNILSWSKIKGIDHYNLYWSNTQKPNTKNAQKITNLQDNFVHKNLTNKKAYYYFLTPVSKSIEGPPSPVVKSIPDLIAPTPKGFNIKVTNNEISLVWVTEPNAIFYTIYWNTKAENLKLKGKRIVTKNAYYVYENPKPNTIYYFAVLANYEDGESLLTKIEKALQIEAPIAEAKNQKNILSWSKIEGIDHYNLYWSNTPKPNTKNAQKITNLQDSFVHKNLTNKKAYYYFLTPVSKSIEGPPSPVIKSIPDLIAPTPKGFNVNVIDNEFSLVWITEPNAISYTIYWNTKEENLKLNGKRIVTKNAYYVHENPKPNTSYYFAVLANYEDGESLLTKIEKALQIEAPIAVSKNQKNILSWSKIKGLDHYNLYWSNTPKPDTKNAQKISNLQDSFVHKNLTNKKAYYYFLTPVSKSIEGPPSPVVKSIPDLIAPIPKGFNIKVADNEFSLVWATAPNAISYTIYWNTKAENLKLNGKRIVIKGSYYVHENPKPNTNYYFAVSANYEDGESLLTETETVVLTAK